jgi:hypothetical protein
MPTSALLLLNEFMQKGGCPDVITVLEVSAPVPGKGEVVMNPTKPTPDSQFTRRLLAQSSVKSSVTAPVSSIDITDGSSMLMSTSTSTALQDPRPISLLDSLTHPTASECPSMSKM